jgi:hypothetical protein
MTRHGHDSHPTIRLTIGNSAWWCGIEADRLDNQPSHRADKHEKQRRSKNTLLESVHLKPPPNVQTYRPIKERDE